ncbi:MAG TPA: hypothetical protein EYP98_09875 [Planctomycetes bacterium]|nr:hypothetical protein [Planctomycetota bacterium]
MGALLGALEVGLREQVPALGVLGLAGLLDQFGDDRVERRQRALHASFVEQIVGFGGRGVRVSGVDLVLVTGLVDGWSDLGDLDRGVAVRQLRPGGEADAYGACSTEDRYEPGH